MKLKPVQTITVALTTAIVAVMLAGCSTPSGYQQADKTGADIAKFREQVNKAKTAVDQTVTTLGQVAVTANTNPRDAFKKFSKSLSNLEAAANKTKASAADMRSQGQAYFAQWEKQLAQIKDPEIRALATAQKAKLQASFGEIRKYSQPLKEQFDPWLSDLQDLRTYLSNDLSVSGVDAAKSLFSKTQTEGLEVQKSMDELVAELNTVAATLTPANVKAK
jgi:Protein of unknown function (DUF2959)